MRVVSLFSGIGGFDLGAERAGLEIVAQVESDPHCQKLLKSKWPGAVLLPDVRHVSWDNLPRADVVCGGWPCQDLSVAGQRAGLAGSRSGLFYEFTRVVNKLQPAFAVWENVPGLFSSDNGRDFMRVLMEFRRLGYNGAWTTLDAQYMGLAQRRGRVFGVFARQDIGAERCAKILSLSSRVRGNSPPGKTPGQDVAGPIGAGAQGSGWRSDTDRATFIAGTLDQGRGGYSADRAASGLYVAGTLTSGAHPGGFNGQDVGNIIAGTVSSKWSKGSGGPSGDECQNLIAHTLRASGADGSEDGTGRGTPLVVVPPLATRPYCDTVGRESGLIAFPERMSSTQAASAENIAPALQSQNPTAVAFQPRIGRNGRGQPEPIVPALNGSNSGETSDMRPCVVKDHTVRRLTPRECERLMGFPDDWTAGFSDSQRYRMLGNAVCVPVAYWIFRRLQAEMSV